MARSPNDAERPKGAGKPKPSAGAHTLTGTDATLDGRARQPKLGEMGTGPLEKLIRDLRVARVAADEAGDENRKAALAAPLRRATAEKKRRAVEDEEAAAPSPDVSDTAADAGADADGDAVAPTGTPAPATDLPAMDTTLLAAATPVEDDAEVTKAAMARGAAPGKIAAAGAKPRKDADKAERKRVKEAERAERKRVKEAEKAERKAARKAERKAAKKAERQAGTSADKGAKPEKLDGKSAKTDGVAAKRDGKRAKQDD